MIDISSCVHERAVFKPNTRRSAAGKAAAATQQPIIQSVLCCRTDSITSSKQQQRQIYLFVNVRQSADFFGLVLLPTNAQKGVGSDSIRGVRLQQ